MTDDTGAVVYAAAHEPYGGIQKMWAASFDPELKFSGKPRDAESGLDYFGARYYDRSQYRFLSVDPVVRRSNSVSIPHRSNLYEYCLDDPVNYLDPNGEDAIHFTIRRDSIKDNMILGVMYSDDLRFQATTMEPLYTNGKSGSAIPAGDYFAKPILHIGKFALELFGGGLNGRRVAIHFGEYREFSSGCILIGAYYDEEQKKLIGSALRVAELETYIKDQMIRLGSESMNQRLFLDTILLSWLYLDYMSWMMDVLGWQLEIQITIVGLGSVPNQSQ